VLLLLLPGTILAQDTRPGKPGKALRIRLTEAAQQIEQLYTTQRNPQPDGRSVTQRFVPLERAERLLELYLDYVALVEQQSEALDKKPALRAEAEKKIKGWAAEIRRHCGYSCPLVPMGARARDGGETIHYVPGPEQPNRLLATAMARVKKGAVEPGQPIAFIGKVLAVVDVDGRPLHLVQLGRATLDAPTADGPAWIVPNDGPVCYVVRPPQARWSVGSSVFVIGRLAAAAPDDMGIVTALRGSE
jgi:hypothetical protein